MKIDKLTDLKFVLDHREQPLALEPRFSRRVSSMPHRDQPLLIFRSDGKLLDCALLPGSGQIGSYTTNRPNFARKRT
jgi:hypothetical protein